jgi:hypothetical protein
MKAVISGVRYDTEKSIVVARVCGNLDTHRAYKGTLYLTPKSRRWFIAGDGGPISLFGQKVGNTLVGGSGLVPISKEQALEFLEHGDDECARALDEYGVELGVVDADELPK